MPASTNQQEKFDQLLSDAVYQSAWRFALSLTGNRHDAEDLLQDALIRAYKGLAGLRAEGRFASWLLSIVRTAFIDRLRRQRARPQADTQLPHYAAAQDADPLSGAVAEALARLPGPQQRLLALFYLDGYSISEAGQALGIRPHVARQRLFRARQALRRELGRIGASEHELAYPSK